mmetsp:Transcript_21482/g.40995  ORF Transcript_21482/g.40995 Transcript_21482/m.40995 type:complete len:554 (+) Transcript_21482:101-1762(+)
MLKELFGCCRRQARSESGPHFSIDEALTLADDWPQNEEDFTYVGVGGQFAHKTNYNHASDGYGEVIMPPRHSRGCRLCAVLTIVIVACSLVAVLVAAVRYGSKLVGPGHDPSNDDGPVHGNRWQSVSGYDCVAGYSSWESGWSSGKKTWCCKHRQRGCVGKERPVMPFSCVANIQNWATGWSASKKKWCCSHLPSSCVRPTQPAKTTTEVPYFCKTGDHAAIGKWSKNKRIWCCLHERRGCPTEGSDLKGYLSGRGADASRNSSSSGSSRSEQFLPRTASATAKACESSCADSHGLSATCRTRLRIVASEEFAGQTYACERAAERVGKECIVCRGCQLDKDFCDDLIVSKVLKSNFTLLHDCLAGFANWEHTWSDDKKAWCCKHGGRGCPSKERQPIHQQNPKHAKKAKRVATPTPSASAGTPAPSAPASPAAHSTPAPSSEKDFDCIAGLATWKDTWSENKKAWCCLHTGRGCPKTDGKFDCVAGYAKWATSWSLDKKAWCCQHHKRGCPPQMTSVPYNCNAGFPKWKNGWSSKKKEWCCRNTGRGCDHLTS